MRAFFTPAWLIDTPAAFSLSAISRTGPCLERLAIFPSLRNEGTSLLWRTRGHSYVTLTPQHYPIMGSLLQRAIQASQVRAMPAAWSLTCGDEQHHGKNGGRIGG